MGGSGGGSAGAVSYPTYMSVIHGLWLDNAGADTPTNSVTDAINAAYGNSPFTGVVVYDPDAALSAGDAAIAALSTVVSVLNVPSVFSTYYTTLSALIPLDTISFDESSITADVVAYDAILTDQLEDIALPAFKSGMLNIGAVNSSAFVIGEAQLRAYKARDLARYGSDLRVRMRQQESEQNTRLILQRRETLRLNALNLLTSFLKQIEFIKDVATITIEANRIRIVAKSEEVTGQVDIDEKDSEWDLALFQFGANLLAGPSGGVGPTQKRPSKAASAIGGALSGAAAGAVVGSAVPGIGTVAGAAAGAILGGAGGALL